MIKRVRIAVLMGGASAERPVSLISGAQVLAALPEDRFDRVAVDAAPGGELAEDFKEALTRAGVDVPVCSLLDLVGAKGADRPDVVFVALHGPGGEDGGVQGFLSTLGLRHTGSGVLASALAMDKLRSKQLFGSTGIPTPAGIRFARRDRAARRRAGDTVGRQIGFPAVIKPNRQGSSFGTSIVREASEVDAALGRCFDYDDIAVVEEKVEGVEITVAVLGNEDPVALPAVEIVPAQDFFDFAAKYGTGPEAANEICPARISEDDATEAAALALECHRALGCRGLSRTDMFVTENGCVVLETNTVPGMTPTSLLPKAAAAAGIDFAALIGRIVDLALERGA
ncbi:MAG: D-alanine--D-alanine ligase [Armatimonadota bacterium]